MTQQEFVTLETFLQYGDLQNAKIIFVGLEEGLGRCTVQLAINARYELCYNPMFNGYRKYVNGVNINDGWYITDSRCLDQAIALINNNPIPQLNNIHVKHDITMQYQARLYWLLQGNNRMNSNNFIANSFPMHITGQSSAMIDYYPFPKKKSNAWPNEYHSNFLKKRQSRKGRLTTQCYEGYYNQLNNNNPRYRRLKIIYNKYNMELSIAYAGKECGNFKLYDFYVDLGFNFNAVQKTDKIGPNFQAGPIIADTPNTAIEFQIGHRVYKKVKQTVVLTPFFTTRQNPTLSIRNIEVISTWV